MVQMNDTQSKTIPQIVRFLIYLISGVAASFASAYSFAIHGSRGDGSWDLSPMLGFVVGGPVWLITFPMIYFTRLRKRPGFAAAFLISSAGAFLATLTIPQLVFLFMK